MLKLTPEAIKFIVKKRDEEQLSFERIKNLLFDKFGINVTINTVQRRYITHRFDDQIAAGILPAPSKPIVFNQQLTPEAIKFIVKKRDEEGLTFEKIRILISEKFGIKITTSTVRNRYMQHRYDDIINNLN